MRIEPSPGTAPDAPFDTRSQAHAAMLALVCDQSPVMSWFSADFSAWPLQQSRFIRQLQQWGLRDPRRPAALRMLAIDWSDVRQNQARFSAWRRDFSHRIECRQLAQRQAQGLEEMLWTPQAALYAHTATWMSGEWVRSPTRLQALYQRFEQAWQQATPAFPATTLGL